jgi:hypothetical protein
MISGVITVVLALAVVTPLCGLLFDCGCPWPWAGLAAYCNIRNFSFFPGSRVLDYTAWRIYSANGGMAFVPETRSLR